MLLYICTIAPRFTSLRNFPPKSVFDVSLCSGSTSLVAGSLKRSSLFYQPSHQSIHSFASFFSLPVAFSPLAFCFLFLLFFLLFTGFATLGLLHTASYITPLRDTLALPTVNDSRLIVTDLFMHTRGHCAGALN